MPTRTIIPAQTAAVTEEADFPSDWYKNIVVAADHLAEAEEVDVFIKIGSTYVVAYDEAGDPYKLTATRTSIPLPGGPIYGFTKDSTAVACGVYVITSRGNKRR